MREISKNSKESPPSGVSPFPHQIGQAPAPNEQREVGHKISAGFPSPAADYIEDGLDLNAYLVQNKPATFLFNVSGDSMTDAGILDGDKVIVDRSITAQHGHIVIAVIDAEYTLKRLYHANGSIELRPENPAYRAICLREGNELEIWGVVTGVVRKYRV